MAPVAVDAGKKAGHAHRILQRCAACGHERWNKAQAQDDFEAILAVVAGQGRDPDAADGDARRSGRSPSTAGEAAAARGGAAAAAGERAAEEPRGEASQWEGEAALGAAAFRAHRRPSSVVVVARGQCFEGGRNFCALHGHDDD